jgi:two-component system, OmpR family, alkaline phosphatase synthesis response regulator PhoP
MEDTKILLVDKDKGMRDFLSFNLKNEGYSVFIAADGKIGINKARQLSPQLIILDVVIPEMDGIEVCKELREMPECKNSRIMFLSSLTEDYTQIAALDAGADDYVLKPIRPRVLISRIKALMRRVPQTNKNLLSLGEDFLIDKSSHTVRIGDKLVTLSKKEFELLELLTAKPGKLYSRHAIHEIVWKGDMDIDDRIIDVHIWKLRQKLGKEKIKTLKGIGYKFDF